MNFQDKTKEVLIHELKELQEAYDSLSVSGPFQDITKRKLAEIALHESEENLSTTLHSIGDGVISTDKNGLVTQMNPVAEKLCGWKLTEASGKPLADVFRIVNSETRTAVADPVAKVLEKGQIVGLANHTVLVSRDGTEFQIADSAAPIINKEGGITGVVLVFSDVTEKYAAQKQIKDSEERYRKLLDNLEAGIVVHAPDTSIVMNNQRASELLGLSNDQMRGKVAIDPAWKFIHEDNTPLTLDEYPVNRIVNGRQPIKNQVLGIHQPGKNNVVWVTVNGFPVLDTKDEITEVVISFIDITERKQAEDALKNRENLLNKVFDVLPIGLWFADANGRLIRGNPAGVKIWGAEPTVPIEEYGVFKARRHPSGGEIGPDDWALAHTIREGVTIIDEELEIDAFDGQKKIILNYTAPVFDNQGNLKGAIVVNHDITGRKKAEEALIRSETELKKAQQITHIGSWYLDVTTNDVLWTDELYKMYGFNPALPPPPYTEHQKLFTIESWETLSSSLAKTRETGIPYELELKTVREDGSNGWMWVRGETVVDIKGQTIGLWGAAQDITGRKQSEEELKKAKGQAEANEEKYRLSEMDMQEAQRLAHIGSWHWDLNTGLVAWSKELYNINGHNPDIPVPVFADMASFYTPESWKAINEAVAKAFNTGEPYNLDFEMVKPDGTIIFTNTRGCANYNEAGEMVNLHGTVQDISERKKTEEALIAAMERAQESDRLKSAFLANMSHEIRTPMNGILGFASLLKEPDLTGEDQQKYIHIIEKSGARMLKIINDIVDISKIEAGLMEVNLKESNINDQLEYIYNFFKPEIEGKGIRLSFKNSLPEKEAFIRTDREKVYAILTNLVKNAIKYTNGGTIDFGYEKKGEYLEFFVKDTGIGIADKRQEVIFERFIQADIEDPRALQGAGLGLTISKAYVEMLGGKIRVESEEGIGSTFYFTIPYNAKNQGKSDIEQPVFAEDIDVQMKKLKILIAEDDETSDFLITLMLKKHSHELFHARTGIEAIELSRKNPDLDLILMDIRMPNINGYDATTKIRQFNNEVIIIAQTAYGLLGDQQKAIDAGCNEYLSKPIKKDELLRLLQKYFQR